MKKEEERTRNNIKNLEKLPSLWPEMKVESWERMRQRKGLREIAIVFERISCEFLIKAFFNAIIREGEQTVSPTLTNNIVDGSQALNNKGEERRINKENKKRFLLKR